MATKREEEQISRYMKLLHISREEAEDMIEYDKEVERNEATEYDLTEEQEKIAHTFITTPERKTTDKTGRSTRNRDNPEKQGIIDRLVEYLQTICSKVEILNKTRELGLTYNGNDYKILLTANKKKK